MGRLLALGLLYDIFGASGIIVKDMDAITRFPDIKTHCNTTHMHISHDVQYDEIRANNGCKAHLSTHCPGIFPFTDFLFK